MRPLILFAALALSVLFVSSTGAFAQWESDGVGISQITTPPNCQNRLVPTIVGRTYVCEVKSSFASDFTSILHFGPGTGHFTLTVSNDAGTKGCACLPDGSFGPPGVPVPPGHNPKFNHSSTSWMCTDNGSPPYVSFTGKVASNGKLTHVVAVNDGGDSFALNCSGP